MNMTLIKDLMDIGGNDKEAVAMIIFFFILITSPILSVLAVHLPGLITDLDVFKLIYISIVGGVITILPTSVTLITAMYRDSYSATKNLLLLASFISAVFVIPIEIILGVIAYYSSITLKVHIAAYMFIALFTPLAVIVLIGLSKAVKIIRKFRH